MVSGIISSDSFENGWSVPNHHGGGDASHDGDDDDDVFYWATHPVQ